MKTKQLLAAISLLLTGCMVSFYVGRTTAPVETQVVVERCTVDHSKDYQVACILNDICHMAIDYESESLRDGDGIHMYAGFEDLYYDVILNLDCYGTDSLTVETFENYVWAY